MVHHSESPRNRCIFGDFPRGFWFQNAQVSFCEGPPPLAWLRSRLAAIIAANPWLSGHLRRNGVNDAVSLRFDAAGATGEVQLLGSVNISSSTPYEVISQQISGSCAEVRPGGPRWKWERMDGSHGFFHGQETETRRPFFPPTKLAKMARYHRFGLPLPMFLQ